MDRIDWGTIILALITGAPPTLLALATLISSIRNNAKTAKLASSVNGHMTTLLEHTKALSKIEGKAEGKSEGLAEGIVKGAELTAQTAVIIPDRRSDKSPH